MDSPLDDIAFLALSENRLAILEALEDEQRYSRDELIADSSSCVVNPIL